MIRKVKGGDLKFSIKLYLVRSLLCYNTQLSHRMNADFFTKCHWKRTGVDEKEQRESL